VSTPCDSGPPSRNVRDRNAAVDRLAAGVFGLRLLLGKLQYFENIVARDEADAGVVGDHEIARLDPDLADLDRPVDLDRLQTPFAR
jgi:hypothetical protein